MGQTIGRYAGESSVAEDYRKLAEEIKSGVSIFADNSNQNNNLRNQSDEGNDCLHLSPRWMPTQ